MKRSRAARVFKPRHAVRTLLYSLMLAGGSLVPPPLQAQTRAQVQAQTQTQAQMQAQMRAQAQIQAPAPTLGRGVCIDEDTVFTPTEAASASNVPETPPRVQLHGLVAEALERSHAIGAARLLADAAKLDVEELAASKALQATLSGGFGPGGSRSGAFSETSGAQLRASINVSQLVYDGGRTDKLVDWRTQLAESARLGHLDQREQLALSAVGLALERGRYRTQIQVYQQNVRKMACLVKALDTVVRTDRGRASELAQAQKSLEQAELAQSQTVSLVRQVEIRLRRLVGDGLPPTTGLATVFNNMPTLEVLVADVDRAHEVMALNAQVRAAGRFAEAAAAADKPQVRWAVAGTAAKAIAGNTPGNPSGLSGNYSVGVMVNVPLWASGVAPARDAAMKRAQAAELRRNDALESRRWRVADLHEQAEAAQDRLRRLSEVLRSSEQVRSATIQQWQQLGRRSLFDVMGAEAEHYALRVAYVNALFDLQQLNASLLALGRGVGEWLR